MIFHSKLGRWLQPGGHLEPSDADPRAAARREVVEDGNGAAFDLDIHRIPLNEIEPDHLHFDLRFLFRARSMVLGRADDPHRVRWVGLDEALELNPEPVMKRILRKLAAHPTLDS